MKNTTKSNAPTLAELLKTAKAQKRTTSATLKKGTAKIAKSGKIYLNGADFKQGDKIALVILNGAVYITSADGADKSQTFKISTSRLALSPSKVYRDTLKLATMRGNSEIVALEKVANANATYKIATPTQATATAKKAKNAK